MDSHINGEGNYVRRVILPSGKDIEVVYFQPFGDEPAAKQTAPNSIEPSSSPLLEALGTLILGIFALFTAPATMTCDDASEAEAYICPQCKGDKVQLVGTPEPEDDNFYTATLRCPECEWYAEDVLVDNDAGERFNRHKDEGTKALVSNLDQADMWVMEDEVERFIGALNADAIDWEDFKR